MDCLSVEKITRKHSDWSRLPYQILDLILKKLVSSTDYLQFSVVCSLWFSITKDNQSKHIKLPSEQIPMLIIPAEEENIWRIYNVMNNKILNLNLSVPHDTRLGGSSEGWLLTVNENHEITLYRPNFMVDEGKISRNKIIHLPPLFPPEPIEVVDIETRGIYVKKVALFTAESVGNPDDLTIVVIFGEFRQLASIRPAKDNQWTRVVDTQMPFDDILYYNNQFYAITMKGKVISFDVTDPVNLNMKVITKEIPEDEEEKEFLGSRSLVESCGELLMVERYWDKFDTGDCEDSEACEDCEYSFDRFTVKFKVFKLSLNGPMWVEIKSLGDISLFLGDNCSFSVMASNFDGCLSNCIYFTHDDDTTGYGHLGPCDLGIYSVERGLFKWDFSINRNVIAKMFERPPIWLVPKINVY